MKCVMLSIRPEWCEKIVNGKVTIEVRKSAPKEFPFKAYIYCTKAKSKWQYSDYEGAYVNSKDEIVYAQQHIIGEFICDKIYPIKAERYDGGSTECSRKTVFTLLPAEEHNALLNATQLTNEEIFAYLGGEGKWGYAWHISDLKIYDKPKELSEFYKPCKEQYYCEACKHGSIIIPPDEEEYALYHGGSYERYETVCHNVVTRPPQSWQYIDEVEE